MGGGGSKQKPAKLQSTNAAPVHSLHKPNIAPARAVSNDKHAGLSNSKVAPKPNVATTSNDKHSAPTNSLAPMSNVVAARAVPNDKHSGLTNSAPASRDVNGTGDKENISMSSAQMNARPSVSDNEKVQRTSFSGSIGSNVPVRTRRRDSMELVMDGGSVKPEVKRQSTGGPSRGKLSTPNTPNRHDKFSMAQLADADDDDSLSGIVAGSANGSKGAAKSVATSSSEPSKSSAFSNSGFGKDCLPSAPSISIPPSYSKVATAPSASSSSASFSFSTSSPSPLASTLSVSSSVSSPSLSASPSASLFGNAANRMFTRDYDTESQMAALFVQMSREKLSDKQVKATDVNTPQRDKDTEKRQTLGTMLEEEELPAQNRTSRGASKSATSGLSAFAFAFASPSSLSYAKSSLYSSLTSSHSAFPSSSSSSFSSASLSSGVSSRQAERARERNERRIVGAAIMSSS